MLSGRKFDKDPEKKDLTLIGGKTATASRRSGPMNRRRFCYVIFLALLLGGSCARAGGRATISEEIRTIRTYPFSDPDPLPVLAGSRNRGIYPYFRCDGFSHLARDQEWKVVRLENDFIRVWVLPQVGGKVWGAIEKSTGRDFIYWNEVLKFRDIAMRGPWTSGGIEFNFGLIGHAPGTAAPVDYRLIEGADGSVSCIVGGIDLPSRTQWRVAIRLPRDEASFETTSFWYNPTPFEHPYYHWMNAAVHAGEDLQFYYPGRYYIGHAGDAHPWPVSENGVDLSLYRNHRFGGHKSLHVLGRPADFSGGYWHDQDFGFGHWAPYSDMPGRKIWIWALSRSGAIWEDLLTDNNGQYVEVQAGRQFSQAALSSGYTSPFTQAAFAPFASDAWRELWFPVKQTGGMVDASPEGILNVTRTEDRIRIAFNALRSSRASLRVRVGGEDVFSEPVNLQPMEVMNKEVVVSPSETDIDVELGDGLRWSSRDDEGEDFSRPMVASPAANPPKRERAFLLGRQHELMRDYAKASEYYRECVAEDPGHVRALARLAEIMCRNSRYQDAREYAHKALAVDTYDPETNYVYGVAQMYLHNLGEAIEALGWAARSPAYRSAAFSLMSEIFFRRSHLEKAVEYARRALEFNRTSIRTLSVLALAQRKLGKAPDASCTLSRILESDPLNHFAHAEAYLQAPTPQNRLHLISLIQQELPHEAFLELAVHYAGLGLTAEATTLLELSPPHPAVLYWLAYLTKDTAADRSREYLAQAASASPYLVFPFRQETFPVLRWALAANGDWKTRYYLALLCWSKGGLDEAEERFRECGNAPDWAPFYLTRAQFLMAIGRPEGDLDYKRALELGPDDWRVRLMLSRHYRIEGEHSLALETAEVAHEKFPDNFILGMEHARALIDAGSYPSALQVLASLKVLPYEGASEGRAMFERANLLLALERMGSGRLEEALEHIAASREWPEHLGAGKPYDADERLQDLMESQVRARLQGPAPRSFSANEIRRLREALK